MSTQHFNIRVPIWSKRAVGINKDLVADHNYITIERINENGEKAYPGTYYIDGKRAREFVLEPASSDPSVFLFIIPISELTVTDRKKGDIVGKIVLFSGEEIEITHVQYERILGLINDNNSQYINVGGNLIKKTAISNVEDTGDENPSSIDRSPEAVAKRQAAFRRRLERNTKDVELTKEMEDE